MACRRGDDLRVDAAGGVRACLRRPLRSAAPARLLHCGRRADRGVHVRRGSARGEAARHGHNDRSHVQHRPSPALSGSCRAKRVAAAFPRRRDRGLCRHGRPDDESRPYADLDRRLDRTVCREHRLRRRVVGDRSQSHALQRDQVRLRNASRRPDRRRVMALARKRRCVAERCTAPRMVLDRGRQSARRHARASRVARARLACPEHHRPAGVRRIALAAHGRHVRALFRDPRALRTDGREQASRHAKPATVWHRIGAYSSGIHRDRRFHRGDAVDGSLRRAVERRNLAQSATRRCEDSRRQCGRCRPVARHERTVPAVGRDVRRVRTRIGNRRAIVSQAHH